MSARREPSVPPVIPGYQSRQLLGMGGFADVFLYQQEMPRRRVAVKVLLASALSHEVRSHFRAEADLMATLSHHPSIVTVFHADVAVDGRPYLVMEYCPRPGLGRRYRTERISVPEALRIGVRLASAVETAHRAGILHRDIKPANVLTTDFGWPALTDFGVAATTGWSVGTAIGMSIPWSPPELLAEDPTGDARSDVYSLAATIYSLLAARSPFETPEGPNSAADLIGRIERSQLTPTGRPDVPDSLEGIFAKAMEKSPNRRYYSALAFARALQQVEAQLSLPLTPLDLSEDPDQEGLLGDDGESGSPDDLFEANLATRLRPVPSVSPDAPAHAPQRAVMPIVSPATDGVPESWRNPDDAEQAVVVPQRTSKARLVTAAVAGVVMVAAVVTAVVLAFRPHGDGGPVAVEPTATSTVPAVRAVPSPSDLTGELVNGVAVFTWENPDPQKGDAYLWGPAEVGGDASLEIIDTTTVSVPVTAGQVCIQVVVLRTDGRYSAEPAVGCVTG